MLCLSVVICYCSRLYQLAKLFLFAPSSGVYSCPLAMTDGAAKTIEVATYVCRKSLYVRDEMVVCTLWRCGNI